MNRLIVLVLIAVAVFVVILMISRPDLMQGIWLWIIGLAGPIVKAFDSLVKYVKGLFSGNESATSTTVTKTTAPPVNKSIPVQPTSQPLTKSPIRENSQVISTPEENFIGTTLTVLRYSDDGQTTIGLLYVNEKFYCYTLEDTFHEPKIPKETRVPAGTYKVDFNIADTKLTLKYRALFPDWFKYHIEIKDIPNFKGVYIHVGNSSKDTEGCLLVADSLTVTHEHSLLSNSRSTYERFYQFISDELLKGKKIQIKIKDEAWVSKQLAS